MFDLSIFLNFYKEEKAKEILIYILDIVLACFQGLFLQQQKIPFTILKNSVKKSTPGTQAKLYIKYFFLLQIPENVQIKHMLF